MDSALDVSEIEPGQPSEPARFLRKQKPVTKPTKYLPWWYCVYHIHTETLTILPAFY